MGNNERIEISIIIPAYNASAYLSETVQSVIDQDFKEWELIIVNDGSTDTTQSLAKSFETDPRISTLTIANAGVSNARNHGFKKSSGKYVAFLDADDVWLPNNLSSKIVKLNSTNAGLAHSNAQLINEHSELLDQYRVGKGGWLLDDLLLWEEECIPAPSSILVQRHVIDKTGAFDASLSNNADQEFFMRVAKDYEIAHVDQVTWQYRIHSANMHSNISLLEKDALKVYSKARTTGLFKSKSFEKRCYANMYSILGACWIGDAKKYLRGSIFLLKAFLTYPLILKRWVKL